jgi:hypothetical protein
MQKKISAKLTARRMFIKNVKKSKIMCAQVTQTKTSLSAVRTFSPLGVQLTKYGLTMTKGLSFGEAYAWAWTNYKLLWESIHMGLEDLHEGFGKTINYYGKAFHCFGQNCQGLF